MKPLMKGFLFLALLFTPIMYPSMLSYAQANPPTEDIVYSFDELSAWCNSHLKTGGRVYLGDNIIISSNISISTNSKMVIDTGKYGLIFDGYSLPKNNLTIIGEGVGTPVVDVYDVGGWHLNWNNAIQDMQITAYGRDGKGGTAVRISQDDPDPVNPVNMFWEGSIQSYGDGAIGVYLAVPLDVYCLNISVEGAQSTAIYSAQGANLYYCKLNACGNRAVSVTGNGNISLNGCAANPQADDFTSTDYFIIDTIGRSFYYPLKQYSKYADFYDYSYTFLLSSSDAKVSYSETLYVTWLPDPNDIDTQTLGSTILSGSLDPPFQELGLESQFPLELVIDIRDPAIPCISELNFHEKGSSVYAGLVFWDTYDPNDENVILWRSDDNGQTWYDFTDSPDLEWDEYNLHYYYGEITGTIILQLEVIGVGESNVVTLRSTDREVGGGIGGDRTGTDRDVSNGNVESPEPEPEPNIGAENPTDTNPPYNNSDAKEDIIPTPDITNEKSETPIDTSSKLPGLPSSSSSFQASIAEATEQSASSAEESAAATEESAEAPGSTIQRLQTNPYLLLGIILSAACTAVFFGLYLWNKQNRCKR